MKKLSFGIVITITASILTGCAIHDGRPPVATFDSAPEYKLKSVKHWQVVADDISNQIAPVAKSGGQAVFIPSSTTTSFGKVFPSLLRSSLVSKGVAVSPSPSGALQVNVNVEEVRHVSLNRYKPGTLTALAAGVMVLREGTETARSAVGSLAALAVGADVVASVAEMDKRPSTEVVLTTSAEKEGRYALYRTDSYYIDSIDSSLFTETGRQFPVVERAAK